MGSLWEREKYSSMCSKGDLWAAVADDEANTPLETEVRGEAQEGRVRAEILGQATCADSMVLDKKEKVCYV